MLSMARVEGSGMTCAEGVKIKNRPLLRPAPVTLPLKVLLTNRSARAGRGEETISAQANTKAKATRLDQENLIDSDIGSRLPGEMVKHRVTGPAIRASSACNQPDKSRHRTLARRRTVPG
jgi:hypothetical protein